MDVNNSFLALKTSDHYMVLISEYKPKLKRRKPVILYKAITSIASIDKSEI
jgi:hypothetical protein